MNRKLFVVSKIVDNNKYNKVFQTEIEKDDFIKNNKSWYYSEDDYIEFYPLGEAIIAAKEIVSKRIEIENALNILKEKEKTFVDTFGNYYSPKQYWYTEVGTGLNKQYEIGRILEVNFDRNEKLDADIQDYLQPSEMVVANHVNDSFILNLNSNNKRRISAWDKPEYNDAVKQEKQRRKDVTIYRKSKRKKEESKKCYIYFIREQKSGYIKIGRTVNVKSRISSIQTSNPNGIDILKVIQGTHAQEMQIHRRFGQHRVNGEWFRADTEILSYIDGLKECEYQ